MSRDEVATEKGLVACVERLAKRAQSEESRSQGWDMKANRGKLLVFEVGLTCILVFDVVIAREKFNNTKSLMWFYMDNGSS